MATMTNPIEQNELANYFLVVHPLDDVPEEKIDTENLGPMAMTPDCAHLTAQLAGVPRPDDASRALPRSEPGGPVRPPRVTLRIMTSDGATLFAPRTLWDLAPVCLN